MNKEKLQDKLNKYKDLVEFCKENGLDYKAININPVCIVEILEAILEDENK